MLSWFRLCRRCLSLRGLRKMNSRPLAARPSTSGSSSDDRRPSPNDARALRYRASVLVLTFVSYACYHLSRKPISVVKAVLHQNCSNVTPPADVHVDPKNATWCDWAPFDGSDGDANALLGMLDSAFLFAYAGGMFISGLIAERVNLRYFLSLGMIFSGLFSCMFGLAKTYDIHSIGYFVFVQAAAGLAQTTGWPGVVTVVGKWFGKGKRGLIFGIWNSHTSIGNILGSVIAGKFLKVDWSLSFIVPGLIIAAFGVIIFCFLVPDPNEVGIPSPNYATGSINTNKRDLYQKPQSDANMSTDDEANGSDETQVFINPELNSLSHRQVHNEASSQNETESTSLLNSRRNSIKAIGFCGALKIPGVVEFSLCLFFSKLVSYTFLYWLPFYIKHSTHFDSETSAYLSTVFDIGGIAGAIIAGVLSDLTGMSATICAVMLIIAAPLMMIYEWFGTINLVMNIFLLTLVGLFVNGPYALITTSISAELGTHQSLEENSKALATVTAIIDGTGSIGAAFGPLIAALVSSKGWSEVFFMLILCDIFALVLLLRLLFHELRRCRRNGPIH